MNDDYLPLLHAAGDLGVSRVKRSGLANEGIIACVTRARDQRKRALRPPLASCSTERSGA